MSAQELAEYRWHNRVIVLCGDSTSALYREQMALLSVEPLIAPWQDRKVVIIESSFFKEESKLCSPNTTFSMQLYGLDGGLKMESDQLVNPQEIMDTIDAMPMRRAEMRRKG